MLLLASPTAAIADPILLPQLASFAVLGAQSVTNTGPTTLSGNLGVSNNPSVTGITGFYGTLANDGPGTFTGGAHQGDAVALLADAQLVPAMTTLDLMGPGDLLPADLGSVTLINDTISIGCEGSGFEGSGGFNGGGGSPMDNAPVPEPGTLGMLASGLLGAAAWARRRIATVSDEPSL